MRLLAVAWLLAVVSDASALEVEIDLGLFNRFTFIRHQVERLLRYDFATRQYRTDRYLEPVVDDLYYSFLARAAVSVDLTRWFGVGLSIDTGELRPMGRVPGITSISLQSPELQQLLQPNGEPIPALSAKDDRLVTANGQPIEDEGRETAFVREVYLRFAAPRTEWLTAYVGRRDIELADGLIYRDFGLNVGVSADLDALNEWPLRFSADLVLASRDYTEGLRSPLVQLRASYLISLLEEVSLLVTYFHDGDDNFARVMSPMASEVSVTTQGKVDQDIHSVGTSILTSAEAGSRADLMWFGLSGYKILGDFAIAATVLGQIGDLVIDNPLADIADLLPDDASFCLPGRRQIALDVLAMAADVGVRYLVTDSLVVGGFFLFLSGEENPFLSCRTPDPYSSFMSIVPYLTHTNIFFSGGMNETFSGRRVSSSGLNARGVITAGLLVDWDVTEDLRAGLKSALLFSDVPSPHGGKMYGVEVDFEASYVVADWLSVSAEYDILVPGNFFRRGALTHKLLLGVDLLYRYES